MSVLQSELARAILPIQSSGSFKATENVNTKMQRRDYMAKQTQISANWILYTPLLGQDKPDLKINSSVKVSAAPSRPSEPVNEKKVVPLPKKVRELRRGNSQSVQFENNLDHGLSQREDTTVAAGQEDTKDGTVTEIHHKGPSSISLLDQVVESTQRIEKDAADQVDDYDLGTQVEELKRPKTTQITGTINSLKNHRQSISPKKMNALQNATGEFSLGFD